MAVTGSYSPAIYSANGSTTVFAVPWKFMGSGDLVVTQTDANNVVTTLILGTDYTVLGAGVDAGGSITFGTAPASGLTITITRSTPQTQPISLPDQGPFAPPVVEGELDRLTLLAQEETAARLTLAAKEAADIATVTAAVAAIGSNGSTLGDTSSILAFGSTTPRTLTNRFTDKINVLDWGADGTGVSDSTAAIQACIDANKGKKIYIPEGTYLVAGILFNGSSYNGTQLICDGGVLKLKPDSGSNFQSAGWVGVIIESADRVLLDLDFDGNRANMSASEHIYLVGIAGATNPTVRLRAKEIRGDGVYVGQSNWTSNSSNPTNVDLDVNVVNSADDGRNAISVISCTGLRVRLNSYQVGGTISSTLEPGGLCIEPDQGYESITDVLVESCRVVTAGTSGLQILGKSTSGVDANRDWNIQGVEIQDFYLKRTGTSGSGLAASNVNRCKDVRITGGQIVSANYGKGIQFDFCDKVDARYLARHVNYGALVAPAGEVRDSVIDVTGDDWSTAIVTTTQLTRCKVKARNMGSTSVAGSFPFAVQAWNFGRLNVVQTDVIYQIDAPYDGVISRAFRNEVSNLVQTFTRCEFQECNWQGYASYSAALDTSVPPNWQALIGYGLGSCVTNDSGKMYIATTGGTSGNSGGPTGTGGSISDGSVVWAYVAPFQKTPFKRSVRWIAETAAPGNGYWVQGEFAPNTLPTYGNAGRTLRGWNRLTTGTGQVLGTDWGADWASTAGLVGGLTPTNGGTAVVDPSVSELWTVTFGNAVIGVTMNPPVAASGSTFVDGQRLLVTIVNSSGNNAPGTIWSTAAGGFALIASSQDPASGHKWRYEFFFSNASGKWEEFTRSAAQL